MPVLRRPAVLVGDNVMEAGRLAYHEHQVLDDDGRAVWRPCPGRGAPARLLYFGGGRFEARVG